MPRRKAVQKQGRLLAEFVISRNWINIKTSKDFFFFVLLDIFESYYQVKLNMASKKNIYNIIWGAIRMYRKNRRSCVTVVNLLFYDWRVLLSSRCAFEGNNVIVKYHLIHVCDCLFMWFWVMMKRISCESYLYTRRADVIFFLILGQKPCVNCHNNGENCDTIEKWYQDVISFSFFLLFFHQHTFFSVHKRSECDCDMWFSLQINKLDWIRLVMKWYWEKSSQLKNYLNVDMWSTDVV